MRKPPPVAAFAAMCIGLSAQSPLTTLYAGGNGIAGGTAVYYNLTVNTPLLITQVDVSARLGTGASSIEFWTCPATWVGNNTNPSAWALRGSSALVPAMPQGTPTVAPMQVPFTLAAGNYGVAIVYNGSLGPSYTNGTGNGPGGNQVYSTAEMTLVAGASGAIFSGAINTPRVWNGSIHYTVIGSGSVAAKTSYGNGCVYQEGGSFYEHFLPETTFDLSNSSFLMTATNPGYLVLPGVGTYRTPSATAVNLNLGDDSDTTVSLTTPFPYDAGTTTILNVSSNGVVAVGNNSVSYLPQVATFLNWASPSWVVWRDFICNATGNVWFEEVGGVAYITWLNVIGYSGQVAGTVTSTFQLQFDTATGNVAYVFRSMDNISVATYPGAGGYIVGYSPGGPSTDPGSINLNGPNTLPLTLIGTTHSLALSASARPIANTTINLVTARMTPGALFGAVALGFNNPALDLASIGMPGCTQYSDNIAVALFFPTASSFALPFQVPNAPGLNIMAQSFCYDPAAALTSLGATASNGVHLVIGTL